MSFTLTSAECDWYAGTFLTEPPMVTEWVGEHQVERPATLYRDPREFELSRRLNAHEVKAIAPVKGYQQGWSFLRHDRQIARLFVSTLPNRPAYFIGTGSDGGTLLEALREPVGHQRWERWEHRVSRFDSKVDVIASKGPAGVLADVERLVPTHIKGRWIGGRQAGDGQTREFGSRQSEVFLRVYDKHADSPERYAPNTVRLEVEFKPQKGRKTWAAHASPAAIWGTAKWLDRVAEYVEVTGERAPRPPAPKSDLDRRLENLCRQYGAVILERLEWHGGDFAALGEELADRASNGGKLPETGSA